MWVRSTRFGQSVSGKKINPSQHHIVARRNRKVRSKFSGNGELQIQSARQTSMSQSGGLRHWQTRDTEKLTDSVVPLQIYSKAISSQVQCHNPGGSKLITPRAVNTIAPRIPQSPTAEVTDCSKGHKKRDSKNWSPSMCPRKPQTKCFLAVKLGKQENAD